jgi:hypothetical protein
MRTFHSCAAARQVAITGLDMQTTSAPKRDLY